MSMKISVKNEDQARTATVVVEDFRIAGEPDPVFSYNKSIGPGESAEFWIHSTKRLVVTEA